MQTENILEKIEIVVGRAMLHRCHCFMVTGLWSFVMHSPMAMRVGMPMVMIASLAVVENLYRLELALVTLPDFVLAVVAFAIV